MSYDSFPSTMHSVTHAYPRGDSVKFGRGYEFNTTPQLPMQRRFRLYFEALQWFFNTDGTLDTTSHPEFNAAVLDQFFQTHTYATPFTYAHLVYGVVVCKFAADTPFEMPKSLKGGTGVTEPVELQLVEQPGL